MSIQPATVTITVRTALRSPSCFAVTLFPTDNLWEASRQCLAALLAGGMLAVSLPVAANGYGENSSWQFQTSTDKQVAANLVTAFQPSKNFAGAVGSGYLGGVGGSGTIGTQNNFYCYAASVSSLANTGSNANNNSSPSNNAGSSTSSLNNSSTGNTSSSTGGSGTANTGTGTSGNGAGSSSSGTTTPSNGNSQSNSGTLSASSSGNTLTSGAATGNGGSQSGGSNTQTNSGSVSASLAPSNSALNGCGFSGGISSLASH